jgi:hypothetical protein
MGMGMGMGMGHALAYEFGWFGENSQVSLVRKGPSFARKE